MKFAVSLAALAFATGVAFAEPPTPPPPAPQGAEPQTLLPALIEHSRSTARLENGRLTGAGADLLRTLGAESQFVAIGEEHGNAGIAQFAEAYWRDLNAVGFNYAAIEVDPWVAEAMERELRAGDSAAWARFIEPRGGAVVAPFFSWDAEAQFADTIVDTSRARREPALWGLDQVFLGATPWLLTEIATNARDPEARAMAAQLADAARGNLSWLGQSETAPLEALRARLTHRRDARFAELVDAMIQSQRIYRPFSGGSGESWFANVERETLMKQNFLAHYRAAERADGAPPRVLLKFGGYHMYRGPTPTMAQGLGGFVNELAIQSGGQSLSIYAACGPGGATAGFAGPPTPCDEGFNESWSFLAPYVSADEITVFDLRAWKLRPRRWAHLSADARQLIASFDVLVIIPNARASEFLPGVTPPSPPPS
ncbi:hypothetical protein [Vitreimonas flagellata]|uniref:hypothetical protein n=1 Tax=Vitreimonas flagellata TaxID=2560861 RepID=UPI0010754DA6|nr:hypothetical protein [Vitreimonas flagellata]